jgi:hypothetical protein
VCDQRSLERDHGAAFVERLLHFRRDSEQSHDVHGNLCAGSQSLGEAQAGRVKPDA